MVSPKLSPRKQLYNVKTFLFSISPFTMKITEIRKRKSIGSFQIFLQGNTLKKYLLLRFQAKKRVLMLKSFFKNMSFFANPSVGFSFCQKILAVIIENKMKCKASLMSYQWIYRNFQSLQKSSLDPLCNLWQKTDNIFLFF